MEREDQLLAEIAERPHDDHLLRVYADHLEERGDPRGELIALQLANTGAARAAEIIAEHGRHWLGPLVSWVRVPECRFARGFVSEVQLADLRRDLGPLIGHPIWSTVRTIHLGRVRDLKSGIRPFMRRVGELIADPVMRSLQSVTESGEPLMIEREPGGGCLFVPRF